MRRPKKKVYDYKKALRENEKKKAPSRKAKLDITPKDEVKEMFRNWFKKNHSVGQVMSKQNVIKDILTKLDSKQNKVLDVAMNELKSSGFMEVKDDGVTLVLTQIGFDSL